MVGGTMVAIDRRTTGTQLEDQSIESKASSRIRELVGDRGHVIVTSYNRTVLLTGEVHGSRCTAVEQAVQRIENVRSTVNELAVMPPSSMSTRSNDSLLIGQGQGDPRSTRRTCRLTPSRWSPSAARST